MQILETNVLTTTACEITRADWKDEYGLAAVLKDNDKYKIHINGIEFTPQLELYYPDIKWLNKETILIANLRAENNKNNFFLFGVSGTILHSFHAGDGIEDIVVCKEGIWVSYFDEGIFGRGISTEGLVMFDLKGDVIFRFHSDVLDRPWMVDCYAITKGKGTTVWAFPYTDFPLLHIQPVTRLCKSYKVPKKLHGSHGLTIRGEYAYFFSPYRSDGEVYSWEIGKNTVQLIGKIDGVTKGLPPAESCHFITVSDKSVTLSKIINDNEYHF